MFEGSIIRTLRREAELLRQLEDAAAAIGDKALESKFKETSAALQRGLPFSASLYL
jgi:superfamily II RNA helicase